jgi:prevent-host-death family protein
MNRIIGVTELQRQFRRVFEEVANNRVPYVLTRGSRPEAALIPYEDYLKFRQVQEAEVEARMARLVAKMGELNTRFSDEEIEADLREADREIERT